MKLFICALTAREGICAASVDLIHKANFWGGKQIEKILSLALVLCILMLAGCGGGSQEAQQETPQDEGKPYKVTLILKNLVNPMWLAVKEGAEAAAAEYGVELTVLAPLKADSNEEQIRQVEDAITKQADAIVLIPSDSQGIIPAVEKANQAGIPVINVNTKVGGGQTETFIAVENYDAASKVAKAVAEKLGGKGKVIILEGIAGAQSAIDLKQGAVDTFGTYEGIEIVASQTANWNRAEAMQVTQNLLQAHPDVDAIFASNDEMAMGAVEAVDQAGLTGKIIIAGLDANRDALEAIKEGKMTITCDKMGFDQGYVGVETAVKVLNNEPVKAFPGVKALDNVSMEVKKGEVHVLLGENGAGKSTLMKILSGVYKKDSGKIFLDGKEVEINSVKDAENLGIAIIHQEFNLLPYRDIAQNIFLGKEPIKRSGIGTPALDKATMYSKCDELCPI